MKKAVLFLFGLGFPIATFAQNTDKLIKEFGRQKEQNIQKFDQILNKNKTKKNSETNADEKARLAGFAGNTPIFLQSDDMRANRSANVLALQTGTLTGLNNTPIEGVGLNILVMDGGRIFEKHREFGANASGVPAVVRVFNKETSGGSNYANHPTNVAGIIGAIGYGSFGAPYGTTAAKGVLTKVNFDSYNFAATPLGTNYQKLAAATTANISNHSYGINLGWYYAAAATATYPQIGWYWNGDDVQTSQDTYAGSYYTQDANFDKIVYNNPNQVVVKSSGNYFGMGPAEGEPKFKWDGATESYVPYGVGDVVPATNCSQGYYCIGWGSLAKNVIVVGAADQLTTANNIYGSAADVVKADYSSTGPRKDGAVKPDLSAVGSNHLIAGYANATNYTAYYSGSGTSYSAPIVSGVAGAVTEINRNLTGNATFTYKADEMKALLTHTTNEAGNPGPDVWFGWGFVDATKAAEVVIAKSQDKVIFERNSLASGVVYSKEVTASAAPLKASISWVDPAAEPFTTTLELYNDNTSRLVNDLDLRIIDTTDNSISYPWKLDVANPMANATKGDNLVDNVEQVLIDAPVAGRTYRIEVSNKGTLVNDLGAAANQNYALIVTGYDSDATLATSNLTTKSVSVYPTKTKDIVNVLIPEGAKTVAVYDMSGKQVLSVKAKSYQTVDLSKLPNGIYIFNIETEKGKISKKVIKE